MIHTLHAIFQPPVVSIVQFILKKTKNILQHSFFDLTVVVGKVFVSTVLLFVMCDEHKDFEKKLYSNLILVGRVVSWNSLTSGSVN